MNMWLLVGIIVCVIALVAAFIGLLFSLMGYGDFYFYSASIFWLVILLGYLQRKVTYYDDELKKCFIHSASREDEAILGLWASLVMTRHSAVIYKLTISEEEFSKVTEEAANVFLRLVGEECFDEAGKAVENFCQKAFYDSLRHLISSSRSELDLDAGVKKATELFFSYTKDSLADLLERESKDSAKGGGEALKNCLVQSARQRDKAILSLAGGLPYMQHTAIAHMVSIPQEDFVKVTEEAAKIYVRLLKEECFAEAVKAVEYGGREAINNSMGYLTTAGWPEFYSDYGIRKAMYLFEDFVAKKLDSLPKEKV